MNVHIFKALLIKAIDKSSDVGYDASRILANRHCDRIINEIQKIEEYEKKKELDKKK